MRSAFIKLLPEYRDARTQADKSSLNELSVNGQSLGYPSNLKARKDPQKGQSHKTGSPQISDLQVLADSDCACAGAPTMGDGV